MVKLRLSDESRVSVVVRSKGLLGALEHELSFRSGPVSITPAPLIVDDANAGLDVTVDARVAVASFLPPDTASASDKKQMLENFRGSHVLDAARFPDLSLRGRYRGTLGGGRLEGDLVVRGAPRAVSFDITVVAEGAGRRARGRWEGTQSELGIKPFKALLGALRLHDWARIDLDLLFVET